MNATFLSRLWTFVVVTFIASLVWLYAEGQAVAEERVTITLNLISPAGQDLLIAESGDIGPGRLIREVSVQVVANGSRGALSRLQTAAGEALEVEMRANAGTPRQERDIQQILEDSQLGNLGLVFEEVEPARLSLYVEPMVRLEQVAVEIRQGADVSTFTEPPTLEQLGVTLMVPESYASAASPWIAIAPFDSLDLSGFPHGVRQTRTLMLELDLPDGLDPQFCSIEPAQLDVNFTLSAAEDTAELSAVPIWIAGPESVHDAYDIQLAPDTPRTVQLTVKGPPELIRQLEDGEQSAAAVVTMTSEDLVGRSGQDAWPITQFLLPSGVTVHNQPDPVTLIISDRSNPTTD